MKNKLINIAGLAAVTSMVLAACAQPTPITITKEVIKEVPKEVIKEVIKEVPGKETIKEVVKEVQVAAGPRTQVRWYVGLGTGSDKDQIPVQKKFVEKYNASQDKIELVVEIVTNGNGVIARDNLKAQIAAGNAPDIVGPVGKYGRAQFKGSWLDVAPLIKEANLDLNGVDQALIDFVKDDGVQVGLPYALFPSFIFVNKDLFDEAKLPLPPQKVGEKYQGKDWDLAAVTQLALKLTVDKNGKDATQPGFDKKNIKQWGFDQQWGNMRSELTGIGGPGLPFEGDAAKLPQGWKDAAHWLYDAIWKQGFYPNKAARGSELLTNGGNEFASGNIGMSWTHTWYMCCLGTVVKNWVAVAPPMVNGKVMSKMHGDTFAIMKDSKQPKAAFQAMIAMMADPELQVLYNGLPARPADRPAFFKLQNETRKLKDGQVPWDMMVELLKYPDIPNHESWMPNMIKAEDRLNAFQDLMRTKEGLNIDEELAKLEKDLDGLYKAK